MEIEFKNLDLIPEKCRKQFENILRKATAEDSKDEELSKYLLSLLDEDNVIDANIAFSNKFFSDFRAAYIENGLEFEESFFESPMDEVLDSDFFTDFGSSNVPNDMGPEPIFTDENERNLFKALGADIEDDQSISKGFSGNSFVSELPTPTIEFDAEVLTNFEEAAKIQEPLLDKTITTEEPIESEAATPALQNSTTSTAIDPANLSQQVVQGMAPASMEREGGLADGAEYLATGAMKLGGTMLRAASSIIEGAGVVTKTAINAGKVAAPFAKNTALSITEKLDALKNSRSKTQISSAIREQLTGLPAGSNVVDISSRMNNAIDRIDPESVKNSLSRIADVKLRGKRNTVASLMRGIEEGYPQGQLSDLAIAEGLTLGDAVNSALNGSKTEQVMSKAIIRGNQDLPDAHVEMEFIGDQYQRLGDALDSLVTQGESLGMSHDDISSQFVEPVQDWMEKRAEEDSILMNLSKIQSENQSAEISPEEAEDRREKYKELAEQIAKLIAKLLNREQDQNESQTATMSISR